MLVLALAPNTAVTFSRLGPIRVSRGSSRTSLSVRVIILPASLHVADIPRDWPTWVIWHEGSVIAPRNWMVPPHAGPAKEIEPIKASNKDSLVPCMITPERGSLFIHQRQPCWIL
ncbi:hypothetical protein Rmet_4604 (plasmid) [Cupriavidus metallidurans CH34]|uniref:Uncharacterized protein n=1 Tax=Cupriavidus metallidurans (strain ATCC 43123 / DSM 2839 / NBRC 102507 / CH34) TaxID=266264 RepID=Q1LEG0_CUPMC|nr:hypothetical protein Rmet_4604 [Cupriavidus metallidurans CH34]